MRREVAIQIEVRFGASSLWTHHYMYTDSCSTHRLVSSMRGTLTSSCLFSRMPLDTKFDNFIALIKISDFLWLEPRFVGIPRDINVIWKLVGVSDAKQLHAFGTADVNERILGIPAREFESQKNTEQVAILKQAREKVVVCFLAKVRVFSALTLLMLRDDGWSSV